MKRIKITKDMIKNRWVNYDNHFWDIIVEYNGKMYNLFLWSDDGYEPSRDEWESELSKELERELENGTN